MLVADELLPAHLGPGGEAVNALALAFLLAATPTEVTKLGPAAPPAPKRVVSLAPSLTETVIALGAADRLVGVTRFDDAPEVEKLPRLGGFTDPSVEAVVALRPDLALVSPSPGNRAAVERMAALGTPVLSVPLGDEAEILAAMRAIGLALGLGERGEALARSTQERIARVEERTRKLPRIKVLIVYDWEPLVVAGPGSFADQLLAKAGGANAAGDAKTPYPTYSPEAAIRAAPVAIVDAAHWNQASRDRILKLPGISKARVVHASRNLFRPGPKLADAVEELARLLRPE